MEHPQATDPEHLGQLPEDPSRDGARRRRSDVFDFDNLVLDRTVRRLDDNGIPFFLANDGTAIGALFDSLPFFTSASSSPTI